MGNRWWISGVMAALGMLLLVTGVAHCQDGQPASLAAELAPVPPPADAIVLFDGTSTEAWQGDGGKPCPWPVVDGAMVVQPGSGSIHTKEAWGDIQYHMQFACPLMPDARGQGRGNSGLYFAGGVEVQILDSYGLESQWDDCAAIYKVAKPLVNACLPPEVWQTYDVIYEVPKFDAEGRKVSDARITVLQNGVVVHWNQVIAQDWRPNAPNNTFAGGILLQDHGNLVRFRNIWLRRLGGQP